MIDENFKLLKKITGVRCNNCLEFIWSKHRHDFRACGCLSTSVDGGRDYLRYSGPGSSNLPKVETYDILIDLKNGTETLLPVGDNNEELQAK